MSEVEAAGAFVRRLQVGGDALAVECGVMSGQQRGADALVLPVRADGQVLMEGTGRVVPVQLLIEGQEVAQVRAGESGQRRQSGSG